MSLKIKKSRFNPKLFFSGILICLSTSIYVSLKASNIQTFSKLDFHMPYLFEGYLETSNPKTIDFNMECMKRERPYRNTTHPDAPFNFLPPGSDEDYEAKLKQNFKVRLVKLAPQPLIIQF